MNTKLILGIIAALTVTGCIHMKAATPMEPAITTDSPKIWVHIDAEGATGIYRCADDGQDGPVCKRAKLEP